MPVTAGTAGFAGTTGVLALAVSGADERRCLSGSFPSGMTDGETVLSVVWTVEDSCNVRMVFWGTPRSLLRSNAPTTRRAKKRERTMPRQASLLRR